GGVLLSIVFKENNIMSNQSLARDRVQKGAAFLDEILPGWHQIIDLDTLNLASGCKCICGQLGTYLNIVGDDTNYTPYYYFTSKYIESNSYDGFARSCGFLSDYTDQI